MRTLPPNWILITDVPNSTGVCVPYAISTRTWQCTLRSTEIADVVAQAWRLDAVIGECETWEYSEVWEQQTLWERKR